MDAAISVTALRGTAPPGFGFLLVFVQPHQVAEIEHAFGVTGVGSTAIPDFSLFLAFVLIELEAQLRPVASAAVCELTEIQ
ncbi:hypothetical protein [Streptomyces anulatus]|uniref:hypothetical protein n=1 Tax=Streptomyces anulatus TaxID=1892 RepID=UPI00367D0F50